MSASLANLDQHAVGADRRLFAPGAGRDMVAVSGTTATDERGMIVGAGQMYVQARQAMVNIRNGSRPRRPLAMHQRDSRRDVRHRHELRFAEVARAAQGILRPTSPPASTVVRRSAGSRIPDMMIENFEPMPYRRSPRISQTASGTAAARSNQKAAVKPPKKSAKEASLEERRARPPSNGAYSSSAAAVWDSFRAAGGMKCHLRLTLCTARINLHHSGI